MALKVKLELESGLGIKFSEQKVLGLDLGLMLEQSLSEKSLRIFHLVFHLNNIPVREAQSAEWAGPWKTLDRPLVGTF
jgi:hypothetical protein